jgi:sugar lactone lactonase YvrE
LPGRAAHPTSRHFHLAAIPLQANPSLQAMTPPLAAPVPLAACGLSDLGEGPVWDDRRSRLYWVDITQGCLRWLDAGAHSQVTWRIGGTLGFVALTTDPGRLVAGHNSTLVELQLDSRQVEPRANLEPAGGPLRCNDGKCDPAGRLWAGTMRWGGDTRPGSLYVVDSAWRPASKLTGLAIANGLAWHRERREMYFVDSPTRRIDRFDWDAGTGHLVRKSPLAEYGPRDGSPDGLTIDAEGNLWVAFWGAGCVRRIDGRSGRTLARVDVPAAHVTSCTFGGAAEATLFITTAAAEVSDAQRAAQPLAGAVFAVETGVRGLPADRFGAREGRP